MSNQIGSDVIAHGQTTEAAAPSPTCPLCHTLDRTITMEALRDGAEWTGNRCGQRWNAARLTTTAAYAQYQATH